MPLTPQEIASATSCHTCLAGFELQVFSYLLAVWAGGSTDPQTLATASTPFQGITGGRADAAISYMLSVIAGQPNDPQAASIEASAACMECLDSIHQRAHIYLLATAAGVSTDPQTLVTASSQFQILPDYTSVILYLLQQKSGVTIQQIWDNIPCWSCLQGQQGRVKSFFFSNLSAPVAFSPLSIPGLKLWLEPSTLVWGDSNPIDTWVDSSGNGNDFSDTGSPPMQIDNAIGSYSVAYFDETQYLACFSVIAAQPYSFFSVVSTFDGGFPQVILGSNSCASGVGFPIPSGLWMYNGLGNAETGSGIIINNTPAVVSNIVTSSLVRTIGFNGVDQSVSVAPSGTGGFDGFISTIGLQNGANYFLGYIAEILVYDTTLSAANQLIVNNYLTSKYGII